MNDQHSVAEIETHAAVEQAGHSDPQFFKPEVSLVILTWMAFAVLLVILTKYAWKPILDGLEKREENIRKSVEEADRIRKEMANLENTKKEIVDQAQRKSSMIIEESRQAARHAGKVIEDQAKAQAQIIVENAQRDASDASNRAYADLKKNSADLVVGLASRLVRENMTDEKNKKLVNELLKDV